jgi:hypothetical protein
VPNAGPYCAGPIRHRHLNQLVRTAASLPGPRVDFAPWSRLAELGAVDPTERPGPAPTAPELRAVVGDCLSALSRRLEEVLPPALARARQHWDRIDDLTIVDEELAVALAEARRTLVAAATAGLPPERAVAFEGLLALDSARGLTHLAERGLASLIRLRVRGREDELLPEGRPFLDLGAALAEAARGWARAWA